MSTPSERKQVPPAVAEAPEPATPDVTSGFIRLDGRTSFTPTLFNRLTGDRHGPITAVAVSAKTLRYPFGPTIHAGQVVFLARCSLFDGLHAFRYRGPEAAYQDQVVVCRAQVLGGGLLRLFFHPREALLVERADVEHLGAVVGCYGGPFSAQSPLLQMYSN